MYTLYVLCSQIPARFLAIAPIAATEIQNITPAVMAETGGHMWIKSVGYKMCVASGIMWKFLCCLICAVHCGSGYMTSLESWLIALV